MQIEIYTVRNIILEHQKVKAYANILYNGTITLSYHIITGNFQIRIFENTVNRVYFYIRIFENTVNSAYIREFKFR